MDFSIKYSISKIITRTTIICLVLASFAFLPVGTGMEIAYAQTQPTCSFFYKLVNGKCVLFWSSNTTPAPPPTDPTFGGGGGFSGGGAGRGFGGGTTPSTPTKPKKSTTGSNTGSGSSGTTGTSGGSTGTSGTGGTKVNALPPAPPSSPLPSGGNGTSGSGIPPGGTLGGGNLTGTLTLGGGTGSCGSGTPQTFYEVLCLFASILNQLIPIIVGLTLLMFIWGLVKFIRASGDVSAIKEGKQFMIWGVLALFVMLSFIGILNLFYSDLFGGAVGVPQLPTR